MRRLYDMMSKVSDSVPSLCCPKCLTRWQSCVPRCVVVPRCTNEVAQLCTKPTCYPLPLRDSPPPLLPLRCTTITITIVTLRPLSPPARQVTMKAASPGIWRHRLSLGESQEVPPFPQNRIGSVYKDQLKNTLVCLRCSKVHHQIISNASVGDSPGEVGAFVT